VIVLRMLEDTIICLLPKKENNLAVLYFGCRREGAWLPNGANIFEVTVGVNIIADANPDINRTIQGHGPRPTEIHAGVWPCS
jgi:hypothetical protein